MSGLGTSFPSQSSTTTYDHLVSIVCYLPGSSALTLETAMIYLVWDSRSMSGL